MNRLTCGFRSSYRWPYPFKEGCEIVKQQWMPLLAAQHPISHVEMVPEIRKNFNTFWISFWQNLHDIDQKGLIYGVSSSYNHLDTSQEDYEVVNQQWMPFVYHSILFPVLRGCPDLTFCIKFVTSFHPKHHGVDHQWTEMWIQKLTCVFAFIWGR